MRRAECRGEITIYPPHDLLEFEQEALDPGLCKGVVVLDPVQQLGEAPEAVRLHP